MEGRLPRASVTGSSEVKGRGRLQADPGGEPSILGTAENRPRLRGDLEGARQQQNAP